MIYINQKGSTMLESLAVLAIVGVLAVSAFKLVYSLFDLFRQNVVTSEIKELKKNVSDRFASDPDYLELKTITFAELCKDQVIPNQMISGGKIYHKLGGEVLIALSKLGDNYFDITFKDVSERGCMNLSQMNWIINQNSDLMQMDINGTVYKLPYGKLTESDIDSLPMTMEKAANSCKKGSGNEIMWTFQ